MSLMDRERDFENRYAHDQELRFRIEARRNKLVGLWAAEKLGLQGEEANAYAQDVIREVFLPNEVDVFKKIRRDFDAAKVEQSDHQIRRHMEDALMQAETELQAS
ncbi:DUF1476 domain-containing protein [Aurantimonas sp. Leaf443]|uniref:DUF1476 domain-containing protein n=1 Tax=Aurantimonas sp. Leaf443 TaxID=1736378 RepID=UPI0006FB4B4A|nr:DUF1476 domain-containing protein [Aurantimonas sp. Leaf443]KQT86262.1 aldolase [Aurantimonas sp. Leaf443]